MIFFRRHILLTSKWYIWYCCEQVIIYSIRKYFNWLHYIVLAWLSVCKLYLNRTINEMPLCALCLRHSTATRTALRNQFAITMVRNKIYFIYVMYTNFQIHTTALLQYHSIAFHPRQNKMHSRVLLVLLQGLNSAQLTCLQQKIFHNKCVVYMLNALLVSLELYAICTYAVKRK